MLHNFGLIKYKKKFLLENYLNINPIYSPKAFKFTNYLYLSPRDNSNNPSNKKLKSSLNNKNRIYPKKENTTKVDTLFRNNINRFISESTNIIENKNSPMHLVQINHNIDDINYEPKKLLTTFSSTKNTNKENNKNNIFNRKNQFNGILKYVKEDIKKKNEFKKKIDEQTKEIEEINKKFNENLKIIEEKEETINNLEIEKENLLNAINLINKNINNKNRKINILQEKLDKLTKIKNIDEQINECKKSIQICEKENDNITTKTIAKIKKSHKSNDDKKYDQFFTENKNEDNIKKSVQQLNDEIIKDKNIREYK